MGSRINSWNGKIIWMTTTCPCTAARSREDRGVDCLATPRHASKADGEVQESSAHLMSYADGRCRNSHTLNARCPRVSVVHGTSAAVHGRARATEWVQAITGACTQTDSRNDWDSSVKLHPEAALTFALNGTTSAARDCPHQTRRCSA